MLSRRRDGTKRRGGDQRRRREIRARARTAASSLVLIRDNRLGGEISINPARHASELHPIRCRRVIMPASRCGDTLAAATREIAPLRICSRDRYGIEIPYYGPSRFILREGKQRAVSRRGTRARPPDRSILRSTLDRQDAFAALIKSHDAGRSRNRADAIKPVARPRARLLKFIS
jgi:hypothetical protein